jgi:SAM-dependent methyltransferase
MLDRNQRTSALTWRVLEDIREIGSAQGDRELGEIWTRHTGGHPRMIAEYGFENFKRTINFNYGQGAIASFHHPLIRRLLFRLAKEGAFPWGAFAPVDWNDLDDIQWLVVVKEGRRLRRLGASVRRILGYAMYTGLLWQFAQRHDQLGILNLVEPSLGHPMPVKLGGRRISQDQALAALDLNRLARVIPLHQVRRVLEIGAGYGRLSYFFHKLFPQAQYVIADIAPALAVSQNYIAATIGENCVERFNSAPALDRNFAFLLPRQMAAVPDGYFDLVINVNSMDEMPPAIVADYFLQIERLCRGNVYLAGWPYKLDGQRIGVEEFPYTPQWKPRYSDVSPSGLGFVEKIFSLGLSDRPENSPTQD